MSRLAKIRLMPALGLGNVARVGAYRLLLHTGWHPAQRLAAEPASGPFFAASRRCGDLPPPNRAWDDKLIWFGWYSEPLPAGAPDWFHNPFGERAESDLPWWSIGDFGGGDIKGVWELSRFDWVVALSTCAAHGDEAALDRLNLWLADWSEHNPPYRGVNWKCGQEASIRVMHLILAALILGQDDAPCQGLAQSVGAHLQRIAPTMSYALGQQNNHGTSEAAALFIGGSFLAGLGDSRGRVWEEQGRSWLEERARTLIARDGSFSQYSVNYHRLMLDTYAIAEAWRRRRGLEPFSASLMERLAAATHWLWNLVEKENGDAPNIGHNDGARLLPLSDAGFRDFRPSVHLAAILFLKARAMTDQGHWDWPLIWLGLPGGGNALPPRRSRTCDDGGYHILRAGDAMACLRYPRFRFRPSQADALHLDLWAGGRNLLRDAGTYSYNAADGSSEFFAGTAAHNTVQFDGRDQMPRIDRFLFGDWLAAEAVEAVAEDAAGASAAAGYRDGAGARHHRAVRLRADGFSCVDRINGRFDQAVLRWRLHPGDYVLDGPCVTGKHLSLSMEAKGARPRLTLTSAPESRHYLQRSEVPVLEAQVDAECIVTTEGRF